MCQSVEERRTVRDGQGNEETTVTRSGGSGISGGPDHSNGPVLQGQPVSGVCSLNCLSDTHTKKIMYLFLLFFQVIPTVSQTCGMMAHYSPGSLEALNKM